MRKILTILLTILLGIALGVGVATLRIRSAPWNRTLDEGGQGARPSSTEGGTSADKLAEGAKLRILDRYAAES
jgi:hypothetical protein